MNRISIQEIENTIWDVIVVGTGIGGGTVGLTLAQAGKRVLFIEKGRSYLNDKEQSFTGKYAEMFFPTIERPEPKHSNILQKAGRWSGLLSDTSGAKTHAHIPFVGSGTGGSSALYGMVMERFWPADFNAVHSADDSSPMRAGEKYWPVSYEQMKPYYVAAEKLYRVRGTADELRGEQIDSLMSPPELTESNSEMYSFLQKKGFHPYQLPLACEFKPGCKNCQGFLCPNDCRNDSGTICVQPAVSKYGAVLLDLCEVKTVKASDGIITSAVCEHQGISLTIRGSVFVLAAGALHTPALLLRSATSEYPRGLANSSDQVGRNLMRHYIDIYAIFSKKKPQNSDYHKQIAFNDLYSTEDGRLGTVQSFGKLPPTEIQVATVYQKLKNSPLPFLAGIFNVFRPIAGFFAKAIFADRLILSSIMEDMPCGSNRITVSDTGDVMMNYHINAAEQARIGLFRKRMKDVLRPYRYFLIKQAESNGRIAHICGTCRIGNDPSTSVLTPQNETHDVKNLYVTDSSFFPTSGGTNPALTIAANALRVGEYIAATWEQKVGSSLRSSAGMQ